MFIDWKGKLQVYIEAVVDLLFETVLLASWIMVTYGIAMLIRCTVGQKWAEIEDEITGIALLIVAIIGGLELILSVTLRTYMRIRKEMERDRQKQA